MPYLGLTTPTLTHPFDCRNGKKLKEPPTKEREVEMEQNEQRIVDASVTDAFLSARLAWLCFMPLDGRTSLSQYPCFCLCVCLRAS